MFGAVLALSTISPLWFLEAIREPTIAGAVALQGTVLVPVSLFALALSGRLRTRRALELASAGLILAVGLACATLVYLCDQPFGTFHHALALTMLAAGLLFLWSSRLTLAVFGVIILAYCAAAGPHAVPGAGMALAEHAGFLIAAGLVGWLGMRSSRSQLALALRRESEVRESNDRLKEVAVAKDRSLAAIAQELRTLIDLVEGPLRRLGWPDDPDAVEQLQAAQTNVRGLARLSDNLLDLSRAETGVLTPRIARLAPGSVISAVVEATRSTAREWGVDVIATPTDAPEEEAELYGDKGQIERLLANLVSCMLERTAAPGTVRVGASCDEHHAVFSIGSTGSDNDGEQAVNAPCEGQSIRLRVVRELLRLHHGELTTRTLPRGRIRVEVRLPLGKEHVRELIDEETDRGGPATSPPSVPAEHSAKPSDAAVIELASKGSLPTTRLDPTTGLATRPALRTRLHHELVVGPSVSVALIDLDGFAQVNEIHGQAMGDRVIAEVGRCLRRSTRSDDLCVRMGGDEFALLLSCSTEAEARLATDRVLQEIAAIEVPSAPGLSCILATRVHASAGVALSQPGDTVDSLLERARAALQVVKKRGGCGVQLAA